MSLEDPSAAPAPAQADGPQESAGLTGQLEAMAQEIRRLSLLSIYMARSGHPGGAMSSAELFACLYGSELELTPANIDAADRNRFVLSKGHGAPAHYAAAASAGLIDPAECLKLRKLGTKMQGHPHVLDLPWVETSTGSLGQGFSNAVGMALGQRHQKIDARTYTMLGDGELQEGQVWEAAMSAAHYKLDNLCAMIDYNKMQSDDTNENIMGLHPLADKWRAFGWHTLEIDGHDIPAILDAFVLAKTTVDKPTMIIADTVKGHGVSYMAGIPTWHGSVEMTPDDTRLALGELGLDDATTEKWMNGNVS